MCLEDRFLPTKQKGTAEAQSLQHIMHVPPSGNPQTTKQRACPCQLLVFKETFPLACPSCFVPQRAGTRSRHCAHLPHQKKLCRPQKTLLPACYLACDAQAKERHEPNVSDSGTLPKHITHRALLMTGSTVLLCTFKCVCWSSRRAPVLLQAHCKNDVVFYCPCVLCLRVFFFHTLDISHLMIPVLRFLFIISPSVWSLTEASLCEKLLILRVFSKCLVLLTINHLFGSCWSSVFR